MLARTICAVAAWGILLLPGCGESVDYPDTAPVTGKVTLDGKPVEGANIVLSPLESGEGHYAARAVSDADGNFVVHTYFSASSDLEGAVPDKYRVAVSKPEVASTAPAAHDPSAAPSSPAIGRRTRGIPAAHGAPTTTNALPEHYADPGLSGLEIDVTSGQDNTLPLELKSAD